eukprot:scaffold2175_cov381-Prasinococcus_capsulatus_cf.AAC.16
MKVPINVLQSCAKGRNSTLHTSMHKLQQPQSLDTLVLYLMYHLQKGGQHNFKVGQDVLKRREEGRIVRQCLLLQLQNKMAILV